MNTTNRSIRTEELLMSKFFLLLLSVALLMLVLDSCSSSRSSGAFSNRPAEPGPGIPPDHCRLVATVVRIDSARSENAANQCSKAPCNATIRVVEVLGYGSAFRYPMAKGNEVWVHFLYTLGSTKELFPDLKPGLPGLQVGATFEAELSAGDMQISTNSTNSPTLLVGHYTLR